MLSPATIYVSKAGLPSSFADLKALEIARIIYGENNLQIRSLYGTLGTFYLHRGIPEKGEYFFLKSLAITENIFDQNHPYIAEEKGNMGFFYLQQGKYKKAELYLLESTDSYIRNYGDNHFGKNARKTRNMFKRSGIAKSFNNCFIMSG